MFTFIADNAWALGASAVSLSLIFPTTHKKYYAPILHVIGNIYWFIYELQCHQYGIMPITAVLFVAWALAIPKWWRER